MAKKFMMKKWMPMCCLCMVVILVVVVGIIFGKRYMEGFGGIKNAMQPPQIQNTISPPSPGAQPGAQNTWTCSLLEPIISAVQANPGTTTPPTTRLPQHYKTSAGAYMGIITVLNNYINLKNRKNSSKLPTLNPITNAGPSTPVYITQPLMTAFMISTPLTPSNDVNCNSMQNALLEATQKLNVVPVMPSAGPVPSPSPA